MKKIVLLFSFFLLGLFCFSQKVTVSGVVLDESGNPLPGVNVIEQGTTNGTLTDVNGKFTFEVDRYGTNTLVISLLGYKKVQQAISANTNINITLKDDLLNLDEVVVTGAGTLTTKKGLGNSISTVAESEISGSGAVSVDAALSGKLAGAQITQNNVAQEDHGLSTTSAEIGRAHV